MSAISNCRKLGLLQLPLRVLARILNIECENIVIEFGETRCIIVHGANPHG
jgi:hypothetical protein